MRLVYLVLLIVSSTPAPLCADQADPALENLFERLRTAPDTEAGMALTRQIWGRWHNVEDDRAASLMRAGVALLTRGSVAEALGVFDRVVGIAPNFAEGWNKRATALYLLDRNTESLADIRRTLELEPRHFGALSGLGLIYLETGRYQAALVAFEAARNINPHMPGVDENIARAQALLREHVI